MNRSPAAPVGPLGPEDLVHLVAPPDPERPGHLARPLVLEAPAHPRRLPDLEARAPPGRQGGRRLRRLRSSLAPLHMPQGRVVSQFQLVSRGSCLCSPSLIVRRSPLPEVVPLDPLKPDSKSHALPFSSLASVRPLRRVWSRDLATLGWFRPLPRTKQGADQAATPTASAGS